MEVPSGREEGTSSDSLVILYVQYNTYAHIRIPGTRTNDGMPYHPVQISALGTEPGCFQHPLHDFNSPTPSSRILRFLPALPRCCAIALPQSVTGPALGLKSCRVPSPSAVPTFSILGSKVSDRMQCGREPLPTGVPGSYHRNSRDAAIDAGVGDPVLSSKRVHRKGKCRRRQQS